MSVFTRRMYEQTVGGRKGFPPWPFDTDEVPCLDAYGIFVQKYEPREDEDRFSEPELVEQPVNCCAGFRYYMASRLTFADFLDLRRNLLAALEERFIEVVDWVAVHSSSYGMSHGVLGVIRRPLRDQVKYLAMDVTGNRRYFEDEGLSVAGEMMGNLLADLYEARVADNTAADILEVDHRELFETLIAPVMVRCEQCTNPRSFEDVPVAE